MREIERMLWVAVRNNHQPAVLRRRSTVSECTDRPAVMPDRNSLTSAADSGSRAELD